MSSGARINSSTVKVNSGSGCRIFFCCSVSHRSRLQRFMQPTRTQGCSRWKQRNTISDGLVFIKQTNILSLQQTPTRHIRLCLQRTIYSSSVFIRHFEYILSWWNIYIGAEGRATIMALYFFIIPTFYVRGILGSFPEGRPSVRLSVCPSPSAHLRQVIYNRCPCVLSAAALQPADTRGRLRYFLIPSAPTEPRQQNSSCAFEVNVCWCDVSSLFVFTFRNCRVFARRVTKQEQ